jgi:dynactin complex subunit
MTSRVAAALFGGLGSLIRPAADMSMSIFDRFMEKDGEMSQKSKRHEAHAQFAKLQRAQNAQRATSDYETTAVALRAKTERLKALRLERDAAAPKPEPAGPKRKSKQKGSGGSLSDFLDGQAKEGRNG